MLSTLRMLYKRLRIKSTSKPKLPLIDRVLFGDHDESLHLGDKSILASLLTLSYDDPPASDWQTVQLLSLLSKLDESSFEIFSLKLAATPAQLTQLRTLVSPLGSKLNKYPKLLDRLKLLTPYLDKQSLSKLSSMTLSQWKLLCVKGESLSHFNSYGAARYFDFYGRHELSDKQLKFIETQIDGKLSELNANALRYRTNLRRLAMLCGSCLVSMFIFSIYGLFFGSGFPLVSLMLVSMLVSVPFISSYERVVASKAAYLHDKSDFISANVVQVPATGEGFKTSAYGLMARVSLTRPDLALILQSLYGKSEIDADWVDTVLSSSELSDCEDIAEFFNSLLDSPSVSDAAESLLIEMAEQKVPVHR